MLLKRTVGDVNHCEPPCGSTLSIKTKLHGQFHTNTTGHTKWRSIHEAPSTEFIQVLHAENVFLATSDASRRFLQHHTRRKRAAGERSCAESQEVTRQSQFVARMRCVPAFRQSSNNTQSHGNGRSRTQRNEESHNNQVPWRDRPRAVLVHNMLHVALKHFQA